MYITGIPRLLDETGTFLAFICTLNVIDTLVGLYAPAAGTGQRRRRVFTQFFSSGLREHSHEFRRFRNLMIHAANYSPVALVCGQSPLHLTPNGGVLS
jgi:hypothetical protein